MSYKSEMQNKIVYQFKFSGKSRPIPSYSCLPNSRAGLIKRAGWNSTEKKLSKQGLLSEQGGRF